MKDIGQKKFVIQTIKIAMKRKFGNKVIENPVLISMPKRCPKIIKNKGDCTKF